MDNTHNLKAGLGKQQGRVSNAISRAAAIVNPAWQTNAVVIDTAYAYNIPLDLSSIGMWIIRMGQGPKCYSNTDPRDPNFDGLVNKIYQNGNCAIGAYVVIDPRYTNAYRYPNIADMYMDWMIPMLDNKVKDTLERKSVNFLALDFEIKYDWHGVQITNSNLFHDVPAVAEAAHARWPNLTIAIYCNGDMLYTPGLCPSLLPWINVNSDWLMFWGAKWVFNRMTAYKSLADYAAVKPSATYKPLGVGSSYNHWHLAQYAGDNGTVPEITNRATGKVTALDSSIYNGTKAQLWATLGFTPADVVIPPPPPPTGQELTHDEKAAILWREAGTHDWNLTK